MMKLDTALAFLAVFTTFYCTETGADVSCGVNCPMLTNSYNLTCTASGSFTALLFNRGSTKVMTCSPGATGGCVPDVLGYQGFKISDTFYMLQVDALQAADSDTWHCVFGTTDSTCQLDPVTAEPTGSLAAACVNVGGDSYEITCSGLSSLGTPAATLSITEGSTTINSTNTGPGLTATQSGAAGKTFTCSLSGQSDACLPASADTTCQAFLEPTTTTETPPPDECDPCKPVFIAFAVISSILCGAMTVVIILVIIKVVSERTTRIPLLVVAVIAAIVALVFIIVTVVLSCAPGKCASLAAIILSVFAVLAAFACSTVIFCFGESAIYRNKPSSASDVKLDQKNKENNPGTMGTENKDNGSNLRM